MTSIPDGPSDKEAKAEEKQAQAETKAQAGREARRNQLVVATPA